MSTSDKTGDRLAASIRRTKAGAAKPPAGSAPEAGQAEQKAAAAKPAAKPAPKAPAPRRAKTAAAPAQSAGDSYQFGRRVWPD